MKNRKNRNNPTESQSKTPRSKPLHIPLSFDAAVEGLLSVKPKKKPSSGSTPK